MTSSERLYNVQSLILEIENSDLDITIASELGYLLVKHYVCNKNPDMTVYDLIKNVVTVEADSVPEDRFQWLVNTTISVVRPMIESVALPHDFVPDSKFMN
ncbi:MAG: hypothetical protein ACRDBG_17115 [Waterburya sp.]